MTRSASMAAAALAVGLAIAAAPAAHADDFSGTYSFNAPAQGYTKGFSTTWTVTPCGDDCRHITTATGGTDTDAHREGPHWVFYRYADPGVDCPSNAYIMTRTKMPATLRYTVDPEKMIGQFQPEGTPCGGTPMPSRFDLTKLS
ncbi:hypothetical protein [[Mycobacterium] vasticus]|uniref:Secreted protein n=1 Tax=[Mycobacterium] vasticus TaxID=2875777 RepID=A0ABU5Z0S5_9MYCO|nr:hypothetical protein [Mycolicibacter sp. MYC017]MEB3071003.1 hypothetical protein [Mycolicibacter sp. MYC017]